MDEFVEESLKINFADLINWVIVKGDAIRSNYCYLNEKQKKSRGDRTVYHKTSVVRHIEFKEDTADKWTILQMSRKIKIFVFFIHFSFVFCNCLPPVTHFSVKIGKCGVPYLH